MSEFNILGNSARISIKAIKYERAKADNNSGANWVICNIIIDIPPFSGNLEASFSTEDFLNFERALAVLSASLKGEVAFETDEGALRLLLVIQSRGEVVIEGEVMSVGSARTSLKFRFLSDQSYLADLRQGIATVTAAFPVRGRVGDSSLHS
jgi:hypothetical protein